MKISGDQSVVIISRQLGRIPAGAQRPEGYVARSFTQAPSWIVFKDLLCVSFLIKSVQRRNRKWIATRLLQRPPPPPLPAV